MRSGRHSDSVRVRTEPGSALGRFALGLQTLRQQAGNPSYETLSYETSRLGHSYSDTSLRNAAAGKQLPTWEVTEMFVRACVSYAHTNPERVSDAARSWTAKELAAQWAQRWRLLRHPPETTEAAAEPVTAANGLPAELTTFFGRERELAEAQRLLARARLVTLVGIGGIGKTRLSLRIAARAARHGARMVELADVDQSGMPIGAVASALGAEGSDLPAVLDFLAGEQLVLVLDNCEHVLDGCAALTRVLLEAAPQLRIVATSRQPLGVTGEHTLPVGPLPVDSGEPARCDAVRLFADRAAAVAPGFALTAGNREIIAQVCRRLDGIPLAIELAARWMRVLSAEDLLERLGEEFRLLRDGDRSASGRHRTLRALFDWSWDLCSAAEQAMWSRLSAAEGDGPLELAADGLGGAEAFDAVVGLVDKSILTKAGNQYSMPGTLRRYGRQRLAEARPARGPGGQPAGKIQCSADALVAHTNPPALATGSAVRFSPSGRRSEVDTAIGSSSSISP
ncbi:ATP-binding protein [Saccharopolyspora elongata]|uniref:ATPase n=1 Tax=Saccharopolyspora elongata TaxID=2530387 RepID=A0A4R4ZDL1_9PSEU|nr:hypothetical protein [Saccharopolyspora elongata]TDD56548.1 hypothetical protein E1288_00175 [Saccharopolyspora elongata]